MHRLSKYAQKAVNYVAAFGSSFFISLLVPKLCLETPLSVKLCFTQNFAGSVVLD